MNSIKERNEQAIKRMKDKAFARVDERCILLTLEELVEQMNIPVEYTEDFRGCFIYYSHNGEVYYPNFQVGNLVTIWELIDELDIEVYDSVEVNCFIQFLASKMDFSEPDEEYNIVYRYSLLGHEDAIKIIKRDWVNQYQIGQ